MYRNSTRLLTVALSACAALGPGVAACGHDGHAGPTYEVTAAMQETPASALRITVVDGDTGQPTAALVRIFLDGSPYVPEAAGAEGGLRFTSIHEGKKQRATVIYATGRGALVVPLPSRFERGEAVIGKGYENRSTRVTFAGGERQLNLEARLEKWARWLDDEGWFACDAHLHYERAKAEYDPDWLTMLEADGLDHAHFMVLQGGNLPGVWADQYAYGKEGRASRAQSWIVPGEEFRDSFQGHYNLFGIPELIEPISTGRAGTSAVPYHYPPAHDVLTRVNDGGGIGGAAHGSRLARHRTAIIEAVSGSAGFMEIANTHLLETELWYRLMNAGILLPPTAGTDLPNYPYRETWQPLLGETRMYVQLGQVENTSFEAWTDALRGGRVFVSSGPLIRLTINGHGLGETVSLPDAGGEVEISARLESTQPLHSLEVLHNGKPVALTLVRRQEGGVHTITGTAALTLQQSGWFAARGTGPAKRALWVKAGVNVRCFAHTAAIPVHLGDRPIRDPEAIQELRQELATHRAAYATDGKFETDADREHMLRLFDRALEKLGD